MPSPLSITAMRWHGRRVAVYPPRTPTDMRKGFDSLCSLVTEHLTRSPLNGDVYLFGSRDRIRAKVLHWDGTGRCLYVKRLERGRFAAVWRDADAEPVTQTVSELDLFLDGSALVGCVALTPPVPPIVETVHTLPPDQRGCPACGGTLMVMAGQYETAERITPAAAGARLGAQGDEGYDGQSASGARRSRRAGWLGGRARPMPRPRDQDRPPCQEPGRLDNQVRGAVRQRVA